MKISSFVPKTLRGYQKSWLRTDLIAGVTLAAVAIPETMGYTSIAQTPILIAETVVRSDRVGQWITVEGSAPVSWTGTPSAARMYFAVEQLYPSTAPTSAFPSYNLDDVFMELDNDGDGLSNAEETTTNPNAKDSDGDTMADKWELANGFNPNDAADAALDADSDGHSNKIEYWANTNPLSAASYPGITSDPLASTATKALLYYLQTRGARGNGRYLTGQNAMDVPGGDYTNYVVGLNTLMTQAGYPSWVSILSIAAEGNGTALQIGTSGPVGRAYMDTGGLVVLHYAPRNPWTLGFNGDKTGVNIPDLLTPGTVANLRMIGWMDAIAAELALYAEFRPDWVLIDNRPTARTSAEKAGIRSAAVLNVHMSNYRAIPFFSYVQIAKQTDIQPGRRTATTFGPNDPIRRSSPP